MNNTLSTNSQIDGLVQDKRNSIFGDFTGEAKTVCISYNNTYL